MTITQKADALARIARQTSINTPSALARASAMKGYLDNADHDSGAYGRIVELDSHSDRSPVTKVARQGRIDTRIKYRKNGKVDYLPAEVKTNGGRIGSLLAPNAPKFVIYSMNFSNSVATRSLSPRLLPTSLFLSILSECGAIKHTNGKNDELAIQVTSLKLYKALAEYPIEYDANAVYEGLLD